MIGRQKELEILRKAVDSDKPELIAVIGRRRVGKTFLVRSFFGDQIDFELVGLKAGTREQQLRNFTYSLKEAQKVRGPIESYPVDWLDAFHQLKEYLDSLGDTGRKRVIFIDELPWVATAKSDFLTGFGYFWNSYASRQKIVVVICGSATAWMIKKIVNNRGGLHNRVTRKIWLQPFSLSETEAYFKSRNISFTRYQLLQMYMAMGGIPHYLDQVEGGKTAIQNIDDTCFHPQGFLRTEFSNLYSSLFNRPERYEAIIGALASSWKGLNRREILENSGLKDGGGISTILAELEQSGFITSYVPFEKKKKDALYRLTDNYSLFYLKFIKDLPANVADNWQSLSQTQSWKSWSGYAFENICLQHIDQIKAKLGISGVHTRQFSFWMKSTDGTPGLQIDLLIDRMDDAISICEIKYLNDQMSITKALAEQLQSKRDLFQRYSKTRKHLFLTLITTYGIAPNQHSLGLIDQVIVMDDLF
ncbi:MAG TPA: ATP-binding protein [Saprospiraceae bacterium]|nr:ATP-binding protein [Saprospiraceae bacterium]HMQ81932.1 ATP-binding protein [Saprospiraceae bacterium]